MANRWVVTVENENDSETRAVTIHDTELAAYKAAGKAVREALVEMLEALEVDDEERNDANELIEAAESDKLEDLQYAVDEYMNEPFETLINVDEAE